ncbi:hypothetical protein CHX27_07395 [Flavobacterium aurantiibacter]|uniref:Uncharacterized protein n=1 Tax=Flavobacterium aurantiibacter TaxID=2023067 RepID=A0A255ZUH8_9FLAO|nr:hypothetical protein CHX27_07395 [Flavobacterium aurantiibacter]
MWRNSLRYFRHIRAAASPPDALSRSRELRTSSGFAKSQFNASLESGLRKAAALLADMIWRA